VAIQALLADEIRVVQASMLGSILSNLLLVLGCCFFFGGLQHKEQKFNVTVATSNMGLLALSSIALVLPTPVCFSLNGRGNPATIACAWFGLACPTLTQRHPLKFSQFAEYYEFHDEHVLIVSRVAAIFLMFMYFQLGTHAHIFDANEDEEEEEELARMSMATACIGLVVVTLLVALFSEFLVGSIEGFTESSGFSRTFVGIILLPIVGNAVEHVSAVTVAMKDKMDLAMGIAVGSCTQISLFVVPLTVLVGWAFGKDMTLNFPHFEIILFILSVFTVSVVCSNPTCNWLEGSLLMTTYCLIAVGFWFEKVRNF
jgi:Ca2+:H+ antiporter